MTWTLGSRSPVVAMLGLDRLPRGWRLAPLRWVLARNDSGAWGDDPDNPDDATIVLRSTEQTIHGYWNIGEPARRLLSPREATATRLEAGDLLVTKSSGSAEHIGKATLVDDSVASFNCGFSNFMQRLRPSRTHDARFLWYVLNSPIARQQAAYLSTTTSGLANLNGGIIGSLQVPVAPLNDQRNIVAFLDHQTSRIDELVGEQESLIRLLDEQLASLVHRYLRFGGRTLREAAFSGYPWIGQHREDWPVVKLRRLLKGILGGLSVPQVDQATDTVPVTRIETISEGVINWNKVGYIRTVDADPKYRLQHGDIVFSNINSLSMIGNAAVYDGGQPLFLGMNCLGLRPASHVEARWIFWWIRSMAFRQAVEAHAKPAINQASISQQALADLRIALPSREAQRITADKLDGAANEITRLRETASASRELLQERRRALISAVVTGQLDVRDWRPGDGVGAVA